MSSEQALLSQISSLMDEEHALRRKIQAEPNVAPEEVARLKEISRTLDGVWAKIRQRRAAEEFAKPAEEAVAKMAGEEGTPRT